MYQIPCLLLQKVIQFFLSRVWLYASKILSKTKVNSGKIQVELAATEVTQTLKRTGLLCLLGMVKPSSLAKVSAKKHVVKSSRKIILECCQIL